jgi:hypothetical protein
MFLIFQGASSWEEEYIANGEDQLTSKNAVE